MNNSVPAVTPEELETKINDKAANEDLLILHVFEIQQFEQEHIPHSLNLPAKNIELLPDLIPEKNRPIILYDKTGESDHLHIALNKLKEMNYQNISILEGGLRAWKTEDRELLGKKHQQKV